MHAKYQIYNFGYHIRKYLFRSKAPHRELYHFDEDEDVDEKPKRQWDQEAAAGAA